MAESDPKLRSVPAVEKVLQAVSDHAATLGLPRPVVVSAVRKEIAALRGDLAKSKGASANFDSFVVGVRAALGKLARSRIQPLINGTGIVVHTNLGRSPLPSAAIEALREIGGNYNNLEYDVDSGARGGRAA